MYQSLVHAVNSYEVRQPEREATNVTAKLHEVLTPYIDIGQARLMYIRDQK